MAHAACDSSTKLTVHFGVDYSLFIHLLTATLTFAFPVLYEPLHCPCLKTYFLITTICLFHSVFGLGVTPVIQILYTFPFACVDVNITKVSGHT